MVSKDLVAASAAPLVLLILRRGPSYGYAITKQVHALSRGRMKWSDGMLYPVLHRLEKKGFVEAFEKIEHGRVRRYYRLTRAGQTELVQQREQWTIVNSALGALWGG
jgi:DNA-binding PadR family transcriptional regulator